MSEGVRDHIEKDVAGTRNSYWTGQVDWTTRLRDPGIMGRQENNKFMIYTELVRKATFGVACVAE